MSSLNSQWDTLQDAYWRKMKIDKQMGEVKHTVHQMVSTHTVCVPYSDSAHSGTAVWNHPVYGNDEHVRWMSGVWYQKFIIWHFGNSDNLHRLWLLSVRSRCCNCSQCHWDELVFIYHARCKCDCFSDESETAKQFPLELIITCKTILPSPFFFFNLKALNQWLIHPTAGQWA